YSTSAGWAEGSFGDTIRYRTACLQALFEPRRCHCADLLLPLRSNESGYRVIDFIAVQQPVHDVLAMACMGKARSDQRVYPYGRLVQRRHGAVHGRACTRSAANVERGIAKEWFGRIPRL